MTTSSRFLSIDCGTQSIRALVFDATGELLLKTQASLGEYQSPQPGWSEQDPDFFWQQLGCVCQQLWQQIDASSITGVAITTQRGTVINVDKNGQSLRPAISWLDQRQAQRIPSLALMDTVLKAVGMYGPVESLKREAESNWIAEHQPNVHKDTSHYLLLSAYLNYRLTGEIRDGVASQVGYIPFDFKALDWADEKSWRYKALNLQRQQMPELFVAGTRLGSICDMAASVTGIPAGVPVFAAGSDKACEVLGSGCIDSSSGAISYGTTATFNVNSQKYFEALPFQPAYPAVVPNHYNVETMVHRGYWMVNWFKKEFGLREEQLASEKNVAPETLFDDLLRQVPAGSMGLVLQPYWSSGANSEGPEAKGAMIGFGDVHTRAHIYRAIIEGIGFALREGKERLEKRGKITFERLRVSGGGSQSDEILQITANLFNLPVERPHTYETSGLGAAMAVAVGTGVYSNFSEAVDAMVRFQTRFEPQADQVAIYEQLFQQVYRKLYKQLRPSYRAIRRITGYPN
jgi:sugar (pentulose or hexulose) kinase